MHAKYFKKITANSDNDALFRETVDQRKCVTPLLQQRSLPGVLTSQTFKTLQILAYAERRFRIYSTIICNSDNQYNTILF